MPRRCDRHEERHAERQVEFAQRERAHVRQADPHHERREHEAHETLREHRKRGAHVEPEKAPPASIRALDIAQEPVHGERETEHEELIRRRLADVERVAHHRGQREPRQEAGAGAIEAPPDPPCEEHRAERRERRPHAHDPLGRADEPHRPGGEPEVERRLLEVRQAVHVGDHPIAALEHLLCDRGVEPLVGIQEGHAELEEEEREADG